MESQHPDPTLLMTMSEALRIDRSLPGAINKVVERNCIGAGQAAWTRSCPIRFPAALKMVEQCQIAHRDGGGGDRARGARPQQRVAGGDGRAARQPARRRGPQDDRLRLRRPGLRSAAAGPAAAVRLARRGGSGQLLRDPALLAGRGRDGPGMPTDWDEDRNLRADGLFYLAGVTGGALFRPSAGLGIVAGADRAGNLGPLRHRLPGAAVGAGRQAPRRSRWRCGASAA